MQSKLKSYLLFVIFVLSFVFTADQALAPCQGIVCYQEITHFDGSENTPSKIALYDDVLFVSDYNESGEAVLLNTTNPLDLNSLGIFPAFTHFISQGTFAYLITPQFGITVYSMANPTAPIFIGNYSVDGVVNDIAIAGEYLYLAGLSESGVADLRIFSIGTPSNITSLGTYSNPVVGSLGFALACSDQYLYLADGVGGLLVFNCSNVINPMPVAAFDDDIVLLDAIVTKDNVAIVNDYDAQNSSIIKLIDVSNKSNLSVLNLLPFEGCFDCFRIQSDYLYLLNTLTIYDISDASSPELVGSFGEGYQALDLVIQGDYLFIIDSEGQIVIFGIDSDREGLPDFLEGLYGTDPNNADTDGDKLSDFQEIEKGRNPLVWDNWERLFGVLFLPLYGAIIIAAVLVIIKVRDIRARF